MFRSNYMLLHYVTTALLSYGTAKQSYQILCKHELVSDETYALTGSIIRQSMIAITFSAMALEAYLNDYAASHLSDKLFYENFDMLRPIGKLQLIAEFILGEKINKGEQMYELITALIKNRNDLAHSKSKDASHHRMNKEDIEAFCKFLDSDEGMQYLLDGMKVDLSYPAEWLDKALDSLRALKALAHFMDSHDESKFAQSSLLLSNSYLSSISYTELLLIKEVQVELGIPTIIEYPKMDGV